MTEELKPSPFCGSSNIGFDSHFGDITWVRCGECEVEGPPMMDEADATVAWNKAIRETKE